MGGACQHDGLQLGVGEQGVGEDAGGKIGAVVWTGMAHGGHGGGLDQRRRVFGSAGYTEGGRAPGMIGAGAGRRSGVGVVGGGGLDRERRGRTPLVRHRAEMGAPAGSGCNRLPEKIGGRPRSGERSCGGRLLAGRQAVAEGFKQLGSR